MVEPGKPDHAATPHRRPPLSSRQILAQIGVAAVILISGIGIGAGGTILALKDRIIPRLRLLRTTDPEPMPGPEPNFLVARWREEYSLTDKQADQISDVLTSQWTATRELWEKFNQAQQTERQKFAASMEKILTPEQYAKWEGDLKKRFEHFRRMRPFDGRGGPPGERRGGPPDERMDRGGPRGGWPPGDRDPNDRRGERRRGRLMRPDGWPGDPNDHRRDGPPDGFKPPPGEAAQFEAKPPMEPNSRPEEPNQPK